MTIVVLENEKELSQQVRGWGC